jgi:hypothetical protein
MLPIRDDADKKIKATKNTSLSMATEERAQRPRQSLDQFTKNYRTFYSKNCLQTLKNKCLDPDPGVKKAADPESGTATLDNAKINSYKHLVVDGRGGEGAESEAELGPSAQSVAALHNARHVEGEDEHEGACGHQGCGSASISSGSGSSISG